MDLRYGESRYHMSFWETYNIVAGDLGDSEIKIWPGAHSGRMSMDQEISGSSGDSASFSE